MNRRQFLQTLGAGAAAAAVPALAAPVSPAAGLTCPAYMTATEVLARQEEFARRFNEARERCVMDVVCYGTGIIALDSDGMPVAVSPMEWREP